MKRFIFLFCHILLVITFIVAMNQLLNEWYYSSDAIGIHNPMEIYLLHALYPIVVGILLAIPYLINELKKPGIVQYDLLRALTLGLPTFILASSMVIYLLSSLPLLGLISSLLAPIYTFNEIYNEIIVISGVILGYTLVTSVKKNEK